MKCVRFTRCVWCSVFCAIAMTAGAWAAEKSSSPNNAVIPVPRDQQKGWMERHEKFNARAKQGNVDLIFIGDSITEGWDFAQGKKTWEKWYGRRNAMCAGINSDRTQNVLWRLDHGNIDGISPKLAVLLIGANTMGNTPEQVVEGIQAIVDKLRTKLPKTKVLVLHLFPQRPKKDYVEQVNKLLPKLHDGKRVFVLDINHNFVGPDGVPSEEMFPDGLHPSAKGYEIWAEAIESQVTTLMGEKEDPTVPVPLQMPNEAAGWMKRHQSMNERVKQGNVDLVFIGDSITHGWENAGKKVWDKFYGKRNAVNLGISRDRTQHALWRLEHGNLEGIAPKLAVVMIGTNNSSRSEPEKIPEGIKAIVDKLRSNSPETKVLLLAIFPRGENDENPWRKVNERVNKEIAKLADDKTVFFMNINPLLLEPDGTLSKEIMPDLLHPNAKGYQIWAEAIEPMVRKCLGEKNDATLPVPKAYHWWLSRYMAMNERVKQGNVDLVFIGDSITHGWEKEGKEVWRKYYGSRNAVNLGIGGDTTENVLWRLDHGNIDGIAPKAAVVMIGTNNTGMKNTPEEIAEGVKAIVEKLRTKLPDMKVLLLGIFPRGQHDYAGRQNNAKANEIIAKLADDKGVFYLDIGQRFLSPDGTISKEIMHDYLHLTPKGYEIWAEAIEPTVSRLMGQRESAAPQGPSSPRESAVTPVPRNNLPKWVERNEAMNQRAKQGDCDLIFIGDSITQGWEGNGKEVWAKYYEPRKAVNLGISGDRTQHVLWRLDHGNLDGIKPKLAVIMIGTNNIGSNKASDASRDKPEEIAAGVRAIVERLQTKQPSLKILVLGIFPRGEKADDPLRKIVAETNALIQKMADEKRRVYFLDINPKFLTEDGTLTREVMPDLLHLTPAGYEIWAEAIEPMVKQLLGEKSATPQSSILRRGERSLDPARIGMILSEAA